MKQGKLEIVKQEMKCLDTAVLRVSKLKWTGVGHFQSDNYKAFHSGNDKLRRNGVALILRQDVLQVFRSYSTRSDLTISIRFLGKPSNITIIHIYVPTTGTEEDNIASVHSSMQKIDHIPKQDNLIITGDKENKSRKQCIIKHHWKIWTRSWK